MHRLIACQWCEQFRCKPCLRSAQHMAAAVSYRLCLGLPCFIEQDTSSQAIVPSLTCVLMMCRHAAQRLSPLEQSIVVGTFLFCTLLLSLIDGDMYYTCRFYHAPIQNFWAVILGLISFQLPLSYWLIRGKSGQVASLWTSSTPAGSSIELQQR